jgi:D-amino-acid dehydrogenase
MSFMTSMLRHCTSARYEIGIARLAQIASSAVLDHRELATQAAGTGFRTTSITSLHKTAKDLDHHLVDYRHMREHLGELTWTVVDRDEMAAGGTNVADGIVGGIRVEHQATVDAPAFVAALEEACIAGGVELTSNTPVHLQSSRGTVVARTLTGDQIRADRFVVAAGAATNEVVRGLGERLPLVAGKGYGFDLKNLSACSEPVYLSEAKVALTPYQDGRLRVAGTMGINSSDGRVSVRRANGILSALGEYLPELHDVPYPKPWTGVRSLTPDGLPLIGPLRRWPTVVVAAGHAMLGITLAPATARIVAELLERPTNHPALAPGRFRTHPY